MEKIEKSIEELECKINPPERDLMTGDVFKMMCKIIAGFAIVWLITIGGFLGYIVYKDYQYSNSVNQMMDKYNEFINSFEFTGETTIDVKDGGNAGIVKNGGTINNGENNNKKNSQEEEWQGEIYP